MAANAHHSSLTQAGTPEQRRALGRHHRKHLSRVALGELHPRPHDFDAVQTLLSASEGRVPALLPVKYSRMQLSPFAFFRGAVSIMAADLAGQPHTGLLVQLCGD